MPRLAGMTLVGALCAVAILVSPARAGTWTPLRGDVHGRAVDAAADGSRILVAGIEGRRLVITTLRDGRVVRRDVARTSARPGFIQKVRVVALDGGRALVVWDDGGRIAAALRPAPGARFGPPRIVSRHTGARLGAARGPAVAAGPGGAVVAWWGGPEGGRLGIWAASLGDDGAWSAPHEISGGAYPVLDPPSPPVVAVGAAASVDGGFAVVWRQPETASTVLTRRASILAATRSATGEWSAPVVLGHASLTSYDLPLIAPSAGGAVTSWADGRTQTPDGVTTSTCLVAAVLRPGSAPVTTTVTCRDQYSPGVVRLVGTAGGGALAAWQVVPDYGPGRPLRAGIELFRLAPGASSWTAAGPAVAGTLGFWSLSAFAPRAGGGALLLADLSQTVRGTGGRQVRGVVVGDDGSVIQRIRGPRSPRFIPGGKTLFALSSGPDDGLVIQDRGAPDHLLRLPAR